MFEELSFTYEWKEGRPLRDYFSDDASAVYAHGTTCEGEDAYRLIVNLAIADRDTFNQGVHTPIGGYDKCDYEMKVEDVTIQDRLDLGCLELGIDERPLSSFLSRRFEDFDFSGLLLEEELFLADHPEVSKLLDEHKADTYRYLADETANLSLFVASHPATPKDLESLEHAVLRQSAHGLIAQTQIYFWGDKVKPESLSTLPTGHSYYIVESRYSPVEMKGFRDPDNRFTKGIVASLITKEDAEKFKELEKLEVVSLDYTDILDSPKPDKSVYRGEQAMRHLERCRTMSRNFYQFSPARSFHLVDVVYDGNKADSFMFADSDRSLLCVAGQGGMLDAEGKTPEQAEIIQKILDLQDIYNKYKHYDDKIFLREWEESFDFERRKVKEIATLRKREAPPKPSSRADKKYPYYRMVACCALRATDVDSIARVMAEEMAKDGNDRKKIEAVLAQSKNPYLLPSGLEFMDSKEFKEILKDAAKSNGGR